MKSLQVYALGGCGMKLAHNQLKAPNKKGFAKPSIAVLDSSKSDMDDFKSTQEISHHIIANTDGMGKDQTLAAKVIRPEIKPFLEKHPPGKVNIVVSSLSGGTGSTASTILIKELLSNDHPTIAMLVANTTNQRESLNTIRTIRSLNDIVKQTNKPLTIMYYENSVISSDYHANVGSLSKINATIEMDYRRLCCMFSGDHVGIDSEDISKFIDYTTVSSTPPKLIELYTSCDSGEVEGYENEIESIVCLSKDPDYTMPSLNQRNEVKGWWAKEILNNNAEVDELLYLITTDSVIKDILGKLVKDANRFKEAEEKSKRNAFDDIDLSDFGETIEC